MLPVTTSSVVVRWLVLSLIPRAWFTHLEMKNLSPSPSLSPHPFQMLLNGEGLATPSSPLRIHPSNLV